MKYIIYIILLFPVCVAGHNIKIPKAEKGTIDLTNWDFNNQNIILDGEWIYYPNNFLPDSNFIPNNELSEKMYVKVPGTWKNNLYDDFKGTRVGYGTYYVKIFLPENSGKYAIRIKDISSASKIFINQNELGRIGKPGRNLSETIPSNKPEIFEFQTDSSVIELFIQVSNFHHIQGGILESIVLGNIQKMQASKELALGINLFLFGTFIITGFYYLILFLLRRKNRYPLFFGLFCFILSLRLWFTEENLIYMLDFSDWFMYFKINQVSFYLAVPIFCLYVYSLYPKDYNRKLAHYFLVFSVALSIFVFITKPQIFLYTDFWYQLITIALGIYISYILYKAILKKRHGARIFAIGWIIFFITVINDILHVNEIITTITLVNIGLFIFIIDQIVLLSSVSSHTFNRAEQLYRKLQLINQNLEMVVEARTLEVSMQKDDIENKNIQLETQKHEIAKQNLKLEEKNKNITDSINYACKIQSAVFPNEENFEKHFKEYLIYFQSKDLISGDFYWFYEWGNKIFFALGDCTGHGVPAAFMSILGLNLLNEIAGKYTNVFSENSFSVHHILNILRKRIISSLNQTNAFNESKDGIDISLCLVDKFTNDFQYAGANQSVYIIKKKITDKDEENELMGDIINIDINNEFDLIHLKGDRMPIGIYPTQDEFTKYQIKLSSEDQIYLFSDGYIDQIGGENNKKFKQKRLYNLLIEIYNLPFKEQKEIFKKNIIEWMGNENEQLDDITVLGVKLF
ncbi:MAG: SpoIIE family protein phosphatase [Bacteroidales bacterium]|nr:SpoIIE family protein phosphatase [Bacteroidales bacterium]